MGSLFLWIYWPSFNGGTAATGDAQQRAFINTLLSLCACTVTVFAAGAGFNHKKQWVMEHLQNATLAGGVAVGACADMMLSPFGAVLMGAMAGFVSVLGFEYTQPFLAQKMKTHDTCGVNNLHGMPSLLGGLLSVLIAGIASKTEYDQFNIDGDNHDKSSLYEIFPLNFENNDSWKWTGAYQAGMQMAGIVVTLVFAVVGGFITGSMSISSSSCFTFYFLFVGAVLKMINSYEQKHLDRWNRRQRDYLFHDDLYMYKESYDNEVDDDELFGEDNGGVDIEMNNKKNLK